MPGQVWNLRAPGQGDVVAVIAKNTFTIVAGQLKGIAYFDRNARQHGVNDNHVEDAYQQCSGTIVGDRDHDDDELLRAPRAYLCDDDDQPNYRVVDPKLHINNCELVASNGRSSCVC